MVAAQVGDVLVRRPFAGSGSSGKGARDRPGENARERIELGCESHRKGLAQHDDSVTIGRELPAFVIRLDGLGATHLDDVSLFWLEEGVDFEKRVPEAPRAGSSLAVVDPSARFHAQKEPIHDDRQGGDAENRHEERHSFVV